MSRKQLEKDLGIGFLISDIARLMRTHYNRIMKPNGLTSTQWRVILHLKRLDGQTQSELADVLDMGKVSLGGLIDRLEESHWVERRADPKDRRMKRIFLTAKVNEIDDEMTKTGYVLIEQTLRNLSEDERDSLVNLLIAVKRNLLEDLPQEKEDS